MTEEEIKRIAEEAGYWCRFHTEVSPRGNGRSSTLVQLMTRSQTQRKTHSFGRIETVKQLSPEEFRARISARFAEIEKKSDAD